MRHNSPGFRRRKPTSLSSRPNLWTMEGLTARNQLLAASFHLKISPTPTSLLSQRWTKEKEARAKTMLTLIRLMILSKPLRVRFRRSKMPISAKRANRTLILNFLIMVKFKTKIQFQPGANKPLSKTRLTVSGRILMPCKRTVMAAMSKCSHRSLQTQMANKLWVKPRATFEKICLKEINWKISNLYFIKNRLKIAAHLGKYQ